MGTMQSNPDLDVALKVAFVKIGPDGKAKLSSLEGKPCTVVLMYGGREITVVLDEKAEVFFNYSNSPAYGSSTTVKKRVQNWYTISFGVGGMLAVDGRKPKDVKVSYRAPTVRRSR